MLHFIRALAAAVAAGSVLVAPASAEDSGGVWTPNPDFTLEIHGSHRTRIEVIDDRYSVNHVPYTLDNSILAIDPVDIGATFPARYSSMYYQSAVASLQTTIKLDARYKFFRIGAEVMDSRAYSVKKHCGTPPFSPPDPHIIINPPTCAQVVAFAGLGNAETPRNGVEPIQLFAGLSFGEERRGGPEFEFIGGRFTLDIGSGRLVGRDEFRNTADSFLGGKAIWRSEDFTLTAFFTRPFIILGRIGNSVQFDRLHETPRRFLETKPDHYFWGAHVEIPEVVGRTSLEAYVYGRREVSHFDINFWSPYPIVFIGDFKSKVVRQQFTPGLRIVRSPAPGTLNFDIEGAAQVNTNPTQLGFFGHAEVGYLSESAWSPHLSLLFDIASGSTARLERRCGPVRFSGCALIVKEGVTPFDPLYGRRDLDFGPTGIFSILDRSNLISPGIRLSAAPTPKLDLDFTYRYARQMKHTPLTWVEVFWYGYSFDDTPAEKIGHQLDASIKYRLKGDRVIFDLGGAALVHGDNPRRPCVTNFYCGGGNVTPYGYASVTFGF